MNFNTIGLFWRACRSLVHILRILNAQSYWQIFRCFQVYYLSYYFFVHVYFPFCFTVFRLLLIRLKSTYFFFWQIIIFRGKRWAIKTMWRWILLFLNNNRLYLPFLIGGSDYIVDLFAEQMFICFQIYRFLFIQRIFFDYLLLWYYLLGWVHVLRIWMLHWFL